MKKIFTMLVLGTALTAQAQQLPNNTFEADAFVTGWNSVGVQPSGWFGSNVNQTVKVLFTSTTKKQQLIYKGDNDEGVKMVNTFVGVGNLGSNAPAYITLGQPWVYAESNVNNCDGGTYGGKAFTYRPDAVQLKYKRTMSTDKPNEVAQVLVYAWKGTTTKSIKWQPTPGSATSQTADMTDRDRDVTGVNMSGVTKSSDFALISNTVYNIAAQNNTEWQSVTIPLTYLDENTKPEKINVVLSAADYYNRNNIGNGNTLHVDDIVFLYYHSLKGFTYDGKAYTFASGATTYELSDVVYDPAKTLTLDKEGVGATTSTSYDEATHRLTVQVKGDDYASNASSVTTYTIQFAAPAPAVALESVKISGESFDAFQTTTTDYTLPYAYHPGIVFEGVATDGSDVVSTYDNAKQTVTLTAGPAVYTFHFTPAVANAQSGDYKGALSVTLTTPDMEAGTPLENADIQLSTNDNGTVNLALNNFSFGGMPVGDIFVSNMPVVDGKVTATKTIRLTAYNADGSMDDSAMGWMLGNLPVKVDATILSTDSKALEANIDIITSANPDLAAMFSNIHVDFVATPLTDATLKEDSDYELPYYDQLTLSGHVTKKAAQLLHTNNATVNVPMAYIDLTAATLAADVTAADLMTGAPAANNTLIYLPASSTLKGANLIVGGVAEQIKLDDALTISVPKAFTAKGVDYNRAFTTATAGAGRATAGDAPYMSSFVLPFTVDAAQVQGTVYKFAGCTGTTLNFTTQTGTLEANTPYLIEAAAEQPFAAATSVNVEPTTEAPMVVTVDGISHIGTYTEQSVASTSTETYFGYSNGEFVKATTGTLAPYRTLIKGAATTTTYALAIDGVLTGIVSLEAPIGKVNVYTTEGKLVREQVDAATALRGLAKGIYVVGGQKVVK